MTIGAIADALDMDSFWLDELLHDEQLGPFIREALADVRDLKRQRDGLIELLPRNEDRYRTQYAEVKLQVARRLHDQLCCPAA